MNQVTLSLKEYNRLKDIERKTKDKALIPFYYESNSPDLFFIDKQIAESEIKRLKNKFDQELSDNYIHVELYRTKFADLRSELYAKHQKEIAEKDQVIAEKESEAKLTSFELMGCRDNLSEEITDKKTWAVRFNLLADKILSIGKLEFIFWDRQDFIDHLKKTVKIK